MSFFKNTNVDDIPDNPNALPNDTYRFRVVGAKLAPTKQRPGQTNFTPKTGITFKYQISTGPWANFFPITDWVQVPDENVKPDAVDRMLSYLKMRLLAFGYSPEEIQNYGDDEFPVEAVINREFFGTTSAKKEGDRVNIRVVKWDPIVEGSEDGYSKYMPDDDPDM